jgi:hypothetical protein
MSKEKVILKKKKDISFNYNEEINKKIEKQNNVIQKKNFNYYDLYRDFDETTNNKDIIHKLEKAPFLFLNDHRQNYFNRYTDIKQCEEKNCIDANDEELVREAYFSEENINIIQNSIIKNVLKQTKKYIISRQKEEDIITLMNGIYHDYAKHLPYNLKEQVKELNERTVNFITPWLINEITAYQNYLIDSNTPLRPPELPINIVKLRKESLPSTFPR